MKLLVKGISTVGKNVEQRIDAVSSRLVYLNPRDYGFREITRIREIKDNNKRKTGRRNKRTY